MPKPKSKYSFKAKVFVYTVEPASWYFVSVDKKMSAEIKALKTKKVGFSFIPVEVTLGKTIWKTTLFPTKEGSYLLALKKDVRIREDIHAGEEIKVSFRLV
ncbi:MAG: DUF1905 domain-containing protein [Patescibacteria group bacterium]